MSPRPHKNLVLWKESMELIKCIYQITVAFPESALLQGLIDSNNEK